ncbi:uncharacterized protein LOC105694434 isoform X2 [Orussus abietinus]|uniref:uncharacterized protein LOC105694434 isoform X2 n=1 Tax=Orussus abietinus TaxID=222816 RepID=UPI000625C2DA|nr:uncharacterized protein LOC105694434 isoform X2 [Orussus abietinus]
MKLLFFALFFIFSGSLFVAICENDGETDCDCDYCEVTKIIGLKGNENTGGKLITSAKKKKMICARDRDGPDRTFPNICYMHCLNHCTLFQTRIMEMNSIERKIVAASRSNYYKLHDGSC